MGVFDQIVSEAKSLKNGRFTGLSENEVDLDYPRLSLNLSNTILTKSCYDLKRRVNKMSCIISDVNQLSDRLP